MAGPTATKDCKGQDEHTDLRTTIQSSTNNIVVPVEEMRMILSQPPLCREANNEIHENRSINAYEEVTHVPKYNGQVDVGEDTMRVELVRDPEGEWD